MTGPAEASRLGVLQLDADGAVVHQDALVADILGVAPAATLAEQFAHATPDDTARLLAAVRAALADGRTRDLELGLLVPGTFEPRQCQVALRPLRHADAVIGAVVCVSDVTASTSESARLRRQLGLRATRDMLTGCLNRAATLAAGEDTLRRDTKPGAGIAIVAVDLDRFKQANETWGHAVGDLLLTEAATRLRACLGGHDVVGRIGGDEFLVACADVPSAAAAHALADRFANTLEGEVGLDGTALRLSASVGVAWTDDPATTVENLLARADEAVDERKRRRRMLVTRPLRTAPLRLA